MLFEFLSGIVAKGGGGDGPEDWVSGYNCILNDMNWYNDSTKIVIHICDEPGHGTSFTSEERYFRIVARIPRFKYHNTYVKNLQIYNQIQSDQDIQFKDLIKQAVIKRIMFFCMNGKRNAMYCFKKTQEFYYNNKGLKFVIQNQFGFGTDKNHDNKAKVNQDDLVEQIKEIALSAVDIAVAVSIGSADNNIINPTDKEFEQNCKKQFDTDFENYNGVLKKKAEKIEEKIKKKKKLKKMVLKTKVEEISLN